MKRLHTVEHPPESTRPPRSSSSAPLSGVQAQATAESRVSQHCQYTQSQEGTQDALTPLLLRPAEAARILDLSRSTIYELMRAGELPFLHIGRAARIPRWAIETWIEERMALEGLHRPPRS